MGNDEVRLNGVHEIDAYGFEDGNRHGLIVFNYALHQSRRITVDAPGLKLNGSSRLWELVSSGPGANNEDAVGVTVQERIFDSNGLELPPCSMAVLDLNE